MDYQDYNIADCPFRVVGTDLVEAVRAMPGFAPFEMEGTEELSFLVLEEEDVPAVEKELYHFEADGVLSVFCKTENGSLLKMERAEDRQILQLWTEKGGQKVFLQGSKEPQLLRFALWMGFGLMNVYEGRICLHCSCIVNDGKAYIFLGESGTGKSTHTRLWGEHIPGSHLLNDDSPILTVREDGIYVYGSPWSGKTPCYQQKCFPLGGAVRLSQAPYNQMTRLSRLRAFAAIHPSCPPDFAYDEYLYSGVTKTLDSVLAVVPFYHLECLPDRAAAVLSYETLTGKSLN